MVLAMKSKFAMLCGFTAAIWLLSGCATTSSEQRASIDEARAGVSRTLSEYAGAIRNDDLQTIMKLFDENQSGLAQKQMKTQLEVMTWLELYSGYKIDLDKTLSGAKQKDLLEGKITLKVFGTNDAGRNFVDRLRMRRKEQGWEIQAVGIQPPPRGAALDLPDATVQKILPTLNKLLKAVKSGSAGTVHTMLPDTTMAQRRRVRPGFWGRLKGKSPRDYAIYTDVHRAAKFDFARWPAPDEEPRWAYVGPAAVLALYEIPYAWPAGGVYDDMLRIEVMITRDEGQWGPRFLRLYGKAIPGSER